MFLFFAPFVFFVAFRLVVFMAVGVPLPIEPYRFEEFRISEYSGSLVITEDELENYLEWEEAYNAPRSTLERAYYSIFNPRGSWLVYALVPIVLASYLFAKVGRSLVSMLLGCSLLYLFGSEPGVVLLAAASVLAGQGLFWIFGRRRIDGRV